MDVRGRHGDDDAEPPPSLPRQKSIEGVGGRRRRTAAMGGGGEGDGPTSPGRPLGHAALPAEDFADEEDNSQMESVLKIFCTHTEPNYSLPWQRKRQQASTSTGFVIAGRRILTNAHSVEHHTQVKVKRRANDERFVATVLAIGSECDLALLSVEDPAFWEGLQPIELGPLPRLQSTALVMGYPIGGDALSVTSGVVSRIEVNAYTHGATELLCLQIDAAINSGNSGGPAFGEGGKCVGVAFQSLKEDAEGIGYLVPATVVQHFLADFDRNGGFTGFPSAGIEWQKVEAPAMKRALGMKPGEKGVLVKRVYPLAPAAAVIKKGDVIMAMDGVAIASDGTVPFRHGERIAFSYVISQKFVGDSLKAPTRLVPVHMRGKAPSYFILGGLVFTPCSVPFLKNEYGKEWDYDSPVNLLRQAMYGVVTKPGEQLVLLSQVLAHVVNRGYEDIVNTQVISVNGVLIDCMRTLVKTIDDCTSAFLTLELDYSTTVILDVGEARKATADILEQHCIAISYLLRFQGPIAQPISRPSLQR